MIERLKFLDDFRGLAIAAMILNHVCHYWTASPVAFPIYLLIYLSVTLAAPLFLFISGFSSFLSFSRFSSSGRPDRIFLHKCLKRGLSLIILGYLINVLFFFDQPPYRSKILFCLGVSSILAYPCLLIVRKKTGAIVLSFCALLVLFSFQFFVPDLAVFFSSHAVLADILAGEFPILPWFAVYLIGLIVGRAYFGLDDMGKRKMSAGFGLAGGALLALWLIFSLAAGRLMLFNFSYDLNLNNYWTAGSITWLWIFGWIMLGWFCLQLARQNFPRGDNALTVIGRNALAAYFIHFFIILAVGESWLKIRLSEPWQLISASVLIIIILWILLKSKQFAKLTAFVRASRKARTS